MEKILKDELAPSKAMKVRIAVGLSLFLTVSVFFCLFLYSYTKTTVREQAIRNLINICQLNDDAITRAFQNRERLVKMIASRLEKRRVSELDEILKELQDFDEAYDCVSMGVLDKDHVVHRTDGASNDLSGESITEWMWSSEPHISESHFPPYSSEYMVNLFSHPVIWDGELQYVIYATYYSKDLTERMNVNSLRGRGFTFLLDRQGKIIIFPHQYEDEAYNQLMQYVDTAPEIVPSKDGDSYFEYRGERYYARFEALGVNDWYLMTCAREADVFAEARFITRSSFLAIGIMWIFIGCSLMVTFYSTYRFQERLYQNYFYDDLLEIKNMNALSVYFKKLPRDLLSKMYLVVFDIDKFKEFNYIYGNENGDRLLKYIVRVFHEECPDVYLFRHSSDYFITLDASKNPEEIIQKIQKTHDRFAQDIENGIIQPFDTSSGIRKIDMDVSLKQLISDAIIARDGIKGNHLLQYAFYDEKLRDQKLLYMEMESKFPSALQNKEFHVYYQPKYDMDTGKIIGAEALARWVKPDGTMISPGLFIPCFETSRQIALLDEAILTDVCRQMKEMQEEGLEIVPVSVNLSRVHLQQAGMLDRVISIIKESGVDPRNLSFEVTESALLEEKIPLKTIAEQLRLIGCRVDMDDYGVGASGPRALASNCFDVVKLDKSFVDEIGNGQVEAVIETTIHLAKKLGLEVLAEGVEEQYQVERLTQLGCFLAQGFYYSKPLSDPMYRECLRKASNAAARAEKSAQEEDRRSYHNCFSEDFCIALDTTEVPIYIIDADTFEIMYANETLRSYMGMNTVGEICHKAIRGLDGYCPDCVVRRMLETGVNEAVEYHLPDDSWTLVKASLLHWRGREFYKLTCTDITKQKQLEKELLLNNKEYSALVHQSTSSILRYDIATGKATVNVDENLNRVEEYIIFNYVHKIIDSGLIEPGSVPVIKEMFSDIQMGLPSKGYDVQVSPDKGEMRWGHLDYTLIENEDGKPYRAVVSFIDNTDQRERELAYQRWCARLNAIMNEYTAYMEVNLSQDMIEAEGRYGSWEQDSGGRIFSKSLEAMASTEIFEEDRFSFRKFFHRERLLGQFLAGKREGTLEYCVTLEGPPQWYKADIQMVNDPSNGDIMASIMVSNVDADIRVRVQMKYGAERDGMTRLYNHAIAEMLIRQVLELSTGERCCLLIIDLDDLRDINSTLGHPEGDRALKAIADCMRAQFRKSDIMGRIGGDEFVVLLRNVPEMESLRSALTGFIDRLNQIKIGPLGDWPIRASMGVTIGTAGVDDFDTLYRQADLALFYTKAMGKNAFHMYTPEMEKRDFSYKPRSAARLTSMDVLGAVELRKLLHAVSAYCSMVVSVNLTQNTYCMMEYVDYVTQHSRDEGSFDQLILEGYGAFHPEDRDGFLARFQREKLLQAYQEGTRLVDYTGRQIGDDGIYRRVKIVAVLMKDEKTGDICEISFTHVMPLEEN